MRQVGRPADQPEHDAPRSLTRRLLWFLGLWVASVAVVGAVAYALRLWIA